MKRSILAIALLLLIATGVSAMAATPEELLDRAKNSRQEAEQALAEARQTHLDERRAIAAELQKAYEDLAEARKQAQNSADERERVERETAETDRSEVETARRIQAMLGAIRAAAWGESETKIDETTPVDEMKDAILRDLQKRIAQIDAQSAIGVTTESVRDRKGAACSVAVLRLGGFAAYACGPTRESCGLLKTAEDGTPMIVGPYLDDAAQAALREAAAGKIAQVPLDPTGGLQNRAPSETASLGSWLSAGGIFVIPILVVGALGILLILERIICLALHKTPASLVRDFLTRLRRGEFEAASGLLGDSQTPTARVLRAGLEARNFPQAKREAEMESAVLREASRMERSLSLLGALAGVAPLLGLLGTVSGMISTFDTISSAGTSNPKLLSGGISEALITTQLGLIVAVPLLLAYATISRWVERRQAMLEHYAIQSFGAADAEAEHEDA